MFNRQYNSRQILNAGEVQVDGMLYDLIYDDLDWQAFHGLLLTNNAAANTGRGEIDFILICEKGVLVLEVKGGLIYSSNNELIQKDHVGEGKRTIDPFNQVRNNVSAVTDILKRKFQRDVFVGEAVIFPESEFSYTGSSFKYYWHKKSPQPLTKFLKATLVSQASHFNFPSLSKKEIEAICKIFSLDVNWRITPLQIKNIIAESEKRGQMNQKILSGIRNNKRIMLEGPPGSGKTVFAKTLMYEKVQKENCRILYLCWNEFLAEHMKIFVKESNIDENVEVMPFYHYVNSLYALLPQEQLRISVKEARDLYSHLLKIASELSEVNYLPSYDYIVVDEAQDLFGQGIDIILDKQLAGGRNGLINGEYLVLFDSLQAFDEGADPERYQLTFHFLKEVSAYYQLYLHFRVMEGSGVANFLDDSMRGSVDLQKNYGFGIEIKSFDKDINCIQMIKQAVVQSTMHDKVEKKNIVVLFSSNLLSGNTINGLAKPLDSVLAADDQFEKLTNENINTVSDKIRYTTALKYKGLESDIVILVLKDLYNVKIKTFYQMYIGASRAKAKVVLMVDANSLKHTNE